MAKNIHGWMGFLSDNEIVCCLWYLDTKFMILVNILFWKMENMWFFTFLGCNWWKMRAAQKLFLILCQVYIYLQKIPRPIRFEEKAEVPPTPTILELWFLFSWNFLESKFMINSQKSKKYKFHKKLILM